jgi:hypothetical protein
VQALQKPCRGSVDAADDGAASPALTWRRRTPTSGNARADLSRPTSPLKHGWREPPRRADAHGQPSAPTDWKRAGAPAELASWAE